MQVFINGISTGLVAGIGDLIAEGDIKKIKNLYRELLTSRIIICGTLSVILLYVISPLVGVWLGGEFIVNNNLVYLIVCSTFLTMTRWITDFFIQGYGMFQDIWAPFAEAGIYIFLAVILGPIYGLTGLLLAPVISTIVIWYIWKPIFLFWKYYCPLKIFEQLKN